MNCSVEVDLPTMHSITCGPVFYIRADGIRDQGLNMNWALNQLEPPVQPSPGTAGSNPADASA
jgi:hypothetical protein